MKAVEVKNLSFSYGSNVVFDNISFTVEKGSFFTVLGKGGSGKTTLFRIFTGDFTSDGVVLYFGKSIKYSLEKDAIGFISPFMNYFSKDIVVDEYIEVLKSKGRPLDKIKSDIERVVKKIGIDHLIYSSFSELSIKEKLLVMLGYQIIFKPKIIFLDNVSSYFDCDFKIFVRELKRLNKKTTVVNITNDTSECIYGDQVYFIGDKFVYNVSDLGPEVFFDNGLRAPFMLLLSSRLKLYDLIDKNYLNMEVLVDNLWK